MKIFIQIASFRDEDVLLTIRSALENAANPQRLTFGICLQYDPSDKVLPQYFDGLNNPNIRVLRVLAADSLGAGFARNMAQQLWSGEEYVLQIDSHMRFSLGWDQYLLNLLNIVESNVVVSAFLPRFKPPNNLEEMAGSSLSIIASFFGHYDSPQIIHLAGCLRKEREPWILRKSPFILANFVFASAEVFSKVPIDPHFGFYGDELSYSARLWTHGYDVVQPEKVIAYHYWDKPDTYKRSYKGYGSNSKKSFERINHLLGLKSVEDPSSTVELEHYSLGSVRTLDSFYTFAGINMNDRTLADFARVGEWGEVKILGINSI
jgi:glycosyltransferase involved in cell wall biosynthesis